MAIVTYGVVGAVTTQSAGPDTYDLGALAAEWRRLYRAHPPKRVARDLLMLGVGRKIQE